MRRPFSEQVSISMVTRSLLDVAASNIDVANPESVCMVLRFSVVVKETESAIRS